MTDDRATLAAFLIAPLVPGVALALSSPGLGGGLDADAVTLAGLAAVGYLYALPTIGLLGLPLFFLLRRYQLVSLLSATTSGTLLTVLVVLAFGSRPNGAMIEWLWKMCVVALVGATTGFVFWTVRRSCLRGAH
jgi:hypothetical protein